MNDWRRNLNRLCTEFSYGVGDPTELQAFCDKANAELGELHPGM